MNGLLNLITCVKKEKINCEVIDLHTLRPLNIKKIIKSIKKTKKLLIVENGQIDFGIGSEILRLLSLNGKILQNTEVKILGIKNSIIKELKKSLSSTLHLQ